MEEDNFDELKPSITLTTDDELYESFEESIVEDLDEEPLVPQNVRLFRVRRNLELSSGKVYRAGVLATLDDVSREGKDILLTNKVITPAKVPPLRAIPGWYERSEMYAKVGIVDVAQFIVADKKRLAKRFHVPEAEIEKQVAELTRYLEIA